MAPFILKFKGNKSFVAFHNMNDGEALTKTWKVCTKVAAHLEQGQRLENLSWRLWHLHNIMVETDNAKSKREFKKLSRNMGDKLDREKGKNIEELRAPGFKRTESSDKMRRRAEEIERLRDESHSGGGMRRMQFTFSLDTPTLSSSGSSQRPKLVVSTQTGKKPPVFKEPAPKSDIPKTAETKQTKGTTNDDNKSSEKNPPANPAPLGQTQSPNRDHTSSSMVSQDSPNAEINGPSVNDPSQSAQTQQPSVHFPSIFTTFDPTALLHPAPSVSPSLSYGEDFSSSYANTSPPNESLGVTRPTIELPLDELLEVDGECPDSWDDLLAAVDGQVDEEHANAQSEPSKNNRLNDRHEDPKPFDLEFEMAKILKLRPEGIRVASASAPANAAPQQQSFQSPASFLSKQPSSFPHPTHGQIATLNPMALFKMTPATANSVHSNVNANGNANTRGNTKGNANGNTTGNTNGNTNGNASSGNKNGNAHTNAGGGKMAPSASVLPMSAPAGQKTECSNCGATHTPLWRRGLNDELNCNACGLYCKLHKRPRPKSMRTSHGDIARSNQTPARNVDSDTVGAKCFNCHTTATPLWRKDDEGKTVCNACGLYYKLHGTNRPLSMKSDVIRKRSRHEIKRAGFAGTSSETPSASPGASRRASPARASSPSLAPEEHREEEKTSQFSYDYSSKSDGTCKNSSPNDMFGSASTKDQSAHASGSSPYSDYFPGPYHPDYLSLITGTSDSTTTKKPGDASGYEAEGRGSKRRRLSSSSFGSSSPTEPPSSATSHNSGQNKSPTSSPPFPSYNLPFSGYFQGFSDAASPWSSAGGRIHPPMALPEDAPMEFLHPPMVLPDIPEATSKASSSVSSYPYIHPPMLPVEEAALSYLHPPMLPQANSPIVGYVHPPMLPNYWNNDQSTMFADTSNGSNENSNAMEMFDSMMKSLD